MKVSNWDILNIVGGLAYNVLHPPKSICIFVTYQAFKSREEIISRKILAEWLTLKGRGYFTNEKDEGGGHDGPSVYLGS